ncbi:hypothetical protein ACJ72_00649 [Emergomyces africanus]|uniref:Anaphase-promoting complex subunit 4 WD40 domain-containing protein n=1 Tax=Emergomyces africanus TaxID=1955775 RepID=A0A1B7P7J7_9EURO|nr:hypothetical protein ACJ72_00649 [Emergomyces africanus]
MHAEAPDLKFDTAESPSSAATATTPYGPLGHHEHIVTHLANLARVSVLCTFEGHVLSSTIMPPAPSRRMVPKDRFGQLFGSLKVQSYYDPAARGPGSHTIRTLAWNPTGSLIATGSVDRTLRIWNPERTHVKYSTELRGHSSGIEKVAFNPVKESELASCSSDGTVRFWDVRSKTCISRVDVGGEAFTMTWAADGSVILVGRKDDTLIPISVESPSTPTLQTTVGTTAPANNFKAQALTPHPQPVQTNATTFSHSFNTSDLDLFLTTGDGTVKIVSYPSFNLLHTIHAHTSACLSIALSPTSRYLAVGGSDALISLWDTTDWICKRTVSSANGGAVRGVSWSWDGRFIVGACDEPGCGGPGLEIFHAETGESVYTIPTGGGLGSGAGTNGIPGIPGSTGTSAGVPAVAWHPSRYWLAYSVTADGMGSSSGGGLRIVGAGSSGPL